MKPVLFLLLTLGTAGAQPVSSAAPYPPSTFIKQLTWHWDTYTNAAHGSDLWPITWGADGNLYAAWGDGGGFQGSDTDSRVALGFARIEGGPGQWKGYNVNGGKSPEHPSSFPKKGKTSGLTCVDGVLYATVNLQDGPWPNVNHVLAWSSDYGATWAKADWLFERGTGHFDPARFIDFSQDYQGLPAQLAGYVYLVGPRQVTKTNTSNELYLARVARGRLKEKGAYQFYHGLSAGGAAQWTGDIGQANAIFSDGHGLAVGGAVYLPRLKRFLLTTFHTGPAQLGIFESENAWGPWRTVCYEEHWGDMGTAGEGLTCIFPQKWMSADGRTLWSVFSVYGDGAKEGIKAHDRFNLIQVTLGLE